MIKKNYKKELENSFSFKKENLGKEREIEFDSIQTRIDIYNYIYNKHKDYPSIFMDGRLHNYFTQELWGKSN